MSTEEPEVPERPSKSRRKREALAQQELGEKLTALPLSTLDRLPLPDRLHSALSEFKRLPNSRGARRRQLQYIGKLMREVDCDSIEASIAALVKPATAVAGSTPLPDLEALSEMILARGDPAITAAVKQYPRLERQRLRQLYRLYRQAEIEQSESSKTTLLRYLSQQLGA